MVIVVSGFVEITLLYNTYHAMPNSLKTALANDKFERNIDLL